MDTEYSYYIATGVLNVNHLTRVISDIKREVQDVHSSSSLLNTREKNTDFQMVYSITTTC